MSDINKISVIVPFYKRDNYAEEIYKSLDYQSTKDQILIELIFVDSKSRTSLENFLRSYKSGDYITHSIIDTTNHVSKKRNIGIKNASSDNIIIIDDDCIPDNNFLTNHYRSLKKHEGQNILFCGNVKFKNNLTNSSNYYRFRNEKHKKANNKNFKNTNINIHNIVTMNMSFDRKSLIKNNLFFNEDFNTYGFEDLQFGVDARLKGFNIKLNEASIFHKESTTLNLYLKKIKSFSNAYTSLFYEYNIKNSKIQDSDDILKKDFDSYRLLRFSSKLSRFINQSNFILKFISITLFHIFKFKRIVLITYLNFTDKFRLCYSYNAYQLLLGVIFLESIFENRSINKNWIEK